MLVACHCCGLIQRTPERGGLQRLACCRCRARLGGARGSRSGLVTGLAASALVLYPAAVALPIMQLSTFGHESSGSVVTGALELWRSGEVLLALLVGVCSLLLPLLKLTGLLLVSRPPRALESAARGRILRLVEWTGRWGMLDVLLIAVVAAWLKLGDLVTVEAGPGVWAFTGMVMLSLLASSAFDPHAAWSVADHDGPPTR